MSGPTRGAIGRGDADSRSCGHLRRRVGRTLVMKLTSMCEGSNGRSVRWPLKLKFRVRLL